MTMLSLAAFAILLREGRGADAALLLLRLVVFGAKGPIQSLQDLRIGRRLLRRIGIGSARVVFRRWSLPLAGSAMFLGIFTVANPIISRELGHWSSWLATLLARPRLDVQRVFLWTLSGIIFWALLRVRTQIRRDSRAGTRGEQAMTSGWTSLLVRCLALFNAVFAVQNLLDALYLFGGRALPEGMTYAEYAHRGSYPLVATALLAAGFVLAAYRPGPATRETTTARRLVLIWLMQNLFLTFSAAWRLHLYTDAYSLTRLRVAAGIWMLLVALGLAWIALRIVSGGSNRWLVSRNLITTTIVLYLCCFVNFEGLIAWHNARHCREAGGSGPSLDFDYMAGLGTEAIPALEWLKARGVRAPEGVLEAKRQNLNALMANWRGWTYRRMVIWNGAAPPSALYR
jgi:hypothetical protein